MKFTARGHPNITAKHSTTFEFTKDDFVTKEGDCIIGVDSDFVFSHLTEREIIIEIEADGIKETVIATLNPDFSSKTEMVIRKSGFLSDRTFAINADKACVDFSDGFREKLKKPGTIIKVTIK